MGTSEPAKLAGSLSLLNPQPVDAGVGVPFAGTEVDRQTRVGDRDVDGGFDELTGWCGDLVDQWLSFDRDLLLELDVV